MLHFNIKIYYGMTAENISFNSCCIKTVVFVFKTASARVSILEGYILATIWVYQPPIIWKS